MKRPHHGVLAVFFLLTFFSTGGGTVESFVNYPTWLLIGKDEFQAFHRSLGPRIVLSMVLPYFLSTVFNALLFWFRPAYIPRWCIWLTLLLALIGWVSTATIQIPIQIQLSQFGYSKEAIERLITTDLVFRVIPGFLRLGIVFGMLWLTLRQMSQTKQLVTTPWPFSFRKVT